MVTARNYLFVPGDTPDKLQKASQRGADALIIDLEDAVPLAGKDAARSELANWVRALTATTEVWVRINNTHDLLVDDIAAVVTPGLKGVVVPKVEDADKARLIASLVSDAEAATGVAPNSIEMLPMVETAGAVLAAAEIASCPRVVTMMIGEYDLAAELGLDPSDDGRELGHVRSAVVIACSAAGIDPPVAPVSTNFTDLDAFRSSTVALRRMGYHGRAVIHPAQIAVVNEVFTPQPEEVERARRKLELYESALREGKGVCVGDDGRLIDEAIVRTSRRVLEVARAAVAPDHTGGTST